MLESNKESLKLEAMKRVVGVSASGSGGGAAGSASSYIPKSLGPFPPAGGLKRLLPSS